MYEQVEPVGQRLATLAEISRGTKSTFTTEIKVSYRSWRAGGLMKVSYEGEARRHGTLIVEVDASPESNLNVLEYFAGQIRQGESDPFPPVLRIISPSYGTKFNKWELLLRLQNHLPNTGEIQIEHFYPPRFMELAFNTLFLPKSSSQLFPRLSTLALQGVTDEAWVEWLPKWQGRRSKRGRVDPLPLKILKIQGGNISDGNLERLKTLVPNVVLYGVSIE